MNLDIPTIEERTGRSMAKGRVDNPILAIGMVSVSEEAADSLYRLKWANDPKSYKDGVKAVLTIANRIREKRRLNINPIEPYAEEVLRYWLAPVCPACFGRKADVIEGTPHLGVACEVCRGTGTRGYTWSGTAHDRFCRELLYAIQDAELRIRGKLLTKLGHQIRDAGLLTTT